MKKLLIFMVFILFLISCETDSSNDSNTGTSPEIWSLAINSENKPYVYTYDFSVNSSVKLFLNVYDKEKDISKIYFSEYSETDSVNPIFKKTYTSPVQQAEESVFYITGSMTEPIGKHIIYIKIEDSQGNLSETESYTFRVY